VAWIEERAGNWRVSWRHNGRRQSCTWGSEKLAAQAKEIAEAHRHDIAAEAVERFVLYGPDQNNHPTESQLPTVREWADVWLSTRTRIGPGQHRRYRSQLDRVILPAIGHLHLDDVTGRHITDLLQKLRGDGLTDATCTRYFAALSSLFRYAVREKKIPDSPCDRTDWVRDQLAHDDASDVGDQHVYLTRAEFQMIRANMAPDGLPLLDLLAGTGARFSEATAVPVDAFVPAGRRTKAKIRIHRAWKQDDKGAWYLGATKGRNRRSVAVGDFLADTVATLAKGRPADALLVTASEGGRVDHSNWRSRRWLPALAAAARCAAHPPLRADGAPDPDRMAVSTCDCETRLRKWPTIHDLRHSYTAWRIAAGSPIASVSRDLGHRTTEVTELIYAGILPEVEDRGADVLEAVLRPAG
jgi:integrase